MQKKLKTVGETTSELTKQQINSAKVQGTEASELVDIQGAMNRAMLRAEIIQNLTYILKMNHHKNIADLYLELHKAYNKLTELGDEELLEETIKLADYIIDPKPEVNVEKGIEYIKGDIIYAIDELGKYIRTGMMHTLETKF